MLDLTDSPIGGAEVTLTGPQGTRTATSGANGTFRFEDLSPGSYTVVASLSGSSGSTCESVSANVQAGGTATAIISCTLATGTLAVTVMVGQELLQGAQVVIFGPYATRSSRTEAMGIARFDVPAGSYSITTVLTGYDCPNASGTVLGGQASSVNIDCAALPGGIRGQVTVDGVGGVFVEVTYSNSMTVLGRTLTADTGDYQFGNVAPGVYTVSIRTPMGAICDHAEAEATVEPSQEAIVDFACTATSGEGTVTGRVMVGGSPVSGATVRVIPWWERNTVTTGADGRFSFTGPAGPITVAAFAPGFDCQPTSVHVHTSQSATGDIPCQPATGSAGRITGRALDIFTHLPLSGGVEIVLTGPVASAVLTDTGGLIVFEDLPPGHYTMGFATQPDSGAFCVQVPPIAVVQAGATTTVDVYCFFGF